MAKKTLQLKAFDGGVNQDADPRDIAEDELEAVVNAYVSSKGRIIMPGDCKANLLIENFTGDNVSPEILGTDTSGIEPSITAGHGLFAFAHDFNMEIFQSAAGIETRGY